MVVHLVTRTSASMSAVFPPENTFDEERGAQNDLTTDEEDSGDYYPRRPPAKDRGTYILRT